MRADYQARVANKCDAYPALRTKSGRWRTQPALHWVVVTRDGPEASYRATPRRYYGSSADKDPTHERLVEGKEALRIAVLEEIRRILNDLDGSGAENVLELYFTSFVIQQ